MDFNSYVCGMQGKRFTTNEFIKQAKEKHGDKYDYSLVEYKNNKTKVKIICHEHGVFEQVPVNHIFKKTNCPTCIGNVVLTKQKFIEKAISKHGNKFDYSLVEYKNNSTKVKIICDKGHMIEQIPNDHLSGKGCYFCCGMGKTTETIIKEFKRIHGNKYNYSLVEYKGAHSKVKIICPIHKVFSQTPNKHLNKHGCPKCGNIDTTMYQKQYPTGWSVTSWEMSAKRSKRFDNFKVYIIKCCSNEEEFYKIGRTYRKTKDRFRGFKYNYEILNEFIFNNAIDCYNEETKIKRLHKNYKYIPKKSFGGMYECFSKIII